ncbi:MAG: hypothetical protein HYU39_01010 [Thaumarchaeota archaeon]|nr:hypothetical protein [Nitrososphaerota archaeon]
MESEITTLVRRLTRTVRRHEEWRRQECITLIPSENLMSGTARLLLASDFGHRYSAPDHFYMGSQFTDEVKSFAEDLARKVFKCKHADVSPLSGHICNMATMLLFTKKGDRMISVSPEHGGYPGISHLGLGRILGLENLYFPFDKDAVNIKTDDAAKLLSAANHSLTVFGSSFIPFPHPLSDLSPKARGTLKIYDGSHVLGLIAGGRFQDPLREGCDLLMGSSHKSFFGPQGGIILSNNSEVFTKIRDNMYLGLVDNLHWNRIAALAYTLIEMLRFGSSYADQVIRNTHALAKGLHDRGLPVRGEKQGFSRSHQLILGYEDPQEKIRIAETLEKAGIITDKGIRMGTCEATRRDMKDADMDNIADIIADLINGRSKPKDAKTKVVALARSHQSLAFTLDT